MSRRLGNADGESSTPVPASGLYFSFVSLAMYDAVVSIKGGCQQYVERDRDFGRASSGRGGDGR